MGPISWRTTSVLRNVALGLIVLLIGGCGWWGVPSTVVVHGTVTCGDDPVDLGLIRFTPINGTQGPRSAGEIRDGHYRIDARGGVPVGRHRVEIIAERRTGEQVLSETDFEPGVLLMVDKTVRVGPSQYHSDQSPLVVDVSRSTRQLDFDLPEQ